jgi:hypothetical protein
MRPSSLRKAEVVGDVEKQGQDLSLGVSKAIEAEHGGRGRSWAVTSMEKNLVMQLELLLPFRAMERLLLLVPEHLHKTQVK